jgi:curved DNA-binding protein CbpA
MSKIKIIDQDIIFLSYDEPNAEKNYADLCNKVPWAKRVHGVKGSDAAHKACAALSETEYFVTVDADNIVDPEFFNVEIDLEDVLKGKTINAEIGAPGGRPKIVNIEIPPGIEHGQQIKYSGMGDASIPNLRPGDLIVNIYVKPHATFRREGESLVIEKTVSVWEALLGTNLEIQTLDNKNLNITIPAGTQPETVLSCRGEGLPNMRSRQRGNLLIKIKVIVPKNLTAAQLTKIQELKDGI